jgi:tRNA modification GTPase
MEPICAPATPLLPSAIAVVRVSGAGLPALLAPLVALPRPGRAAPRRLEWEGYSETALVLFFASPDSYTGEDVVELQLHGNPLLVRRLLERLGALGVRAALPGEFTLRALLNGKKDLLEVEALNDLYAAATDSQIRQAQARAGGMPAWLKDARSALSRMAAAAEASVDYGEDEGIALDVGALKREAAELRAVFHVEQRRAAAAGRLRGGIRLAIAGRPNAGKSTLFNALVQEDRAIVADLPGTTRDVLEAECEWVGLPLRVYDTAGLRDSQDSIERLGVARADTVLERADLVLHLVPVVDDGQDTEVAARLAPYAGKVLLVRNQADLAGAAGGGSLDPGEIRISALKGDLAQLESAIKARFLDGRSPDSCLGALATERQRGALADLLGQVDMLAQLPDGCPHELPASLLQGALGLVARLTGEDRAGLALDAMFDAFCLGK